MKPQVKICGLKTPESVDTAIRNGADFIGLMFYQPSPRNVSIDQGRLLAEQARGHSKIVAVTVDASDDFLQAITTQVHPDFIQLHGSETPDRIAEIKHTTGLPVIKAIKVRNRQDVDEATAFEETADIILFDARAPDNQVDALPGGNGIRFDWSLLSSASPPANFMLSGGLNPDNIADAVTATNAAYFDVSSGVELSPGEKDLTAIKKFIVALRNAG